MTILFTGFEPFGGDTVNPSWEAVSRLPDTISGNDVVKLQLPVEYHRVRQLLREAVDRHHPDVVVCVGQAGGRARITPEKVAINCMDASIADGAGYLASGEPVIENGETAFFSTLPIKRMTRMMNERGVPAALSYSAGTYVCNSTMYHLLDLIHTEYPHTLGGFVHIPFMCEQVVNRPIGTPSLPLSTIIQGLTIIAEAVTGPEDQQTAGGYTH